MLKALPQHVSTPMLGNCHTLADFGLAAPGSTILQPSMADGGVATTHRFARLHRFVPILETSTAPNSVDAAIAKLETADAMGPGICTLGAIQGTLDPAPAMPVQKHGRTTGRTFGIIDDASVDVLVPLRREDPDRLSLFRDQIRIRPVPGQMVVAQPGDSGALVLARAGNRAVGLLFACPDNGSFAYASPVAAVLDALDIELA